MLYIIIYYSMFLITPLLLIGIIIWSAVKYHGVKKKIREGTQEHLGEKLWKYRTVLQVSSIIFVLLLLVIGVPAIFLSIALRSM